jgi:hypothetical protein
MTSESENIVASMEAARRQGARAATELKHEVSRLTDWREHVRSNPLPFLLGAVSLGYYLIPTRTEIKRHQTAPDPLSGTATPLKAKESSSLTHRLSNSIREQMTTMAEKWVTAAFSNFAAKQFQSFQENQDDHPTKSKSTQK